MILSPAPMLCCTLVLVLGELFVRHRGQGDRGKKLKEKGGRNGYGMSVVSFFFNFQSHETLPQKRGRN